MTALVRSPSPDHRCPVGVERDDDRSVPEARLTTFIGGCQRPVRSRAAPYRMGVDLGSSLSRGVLARFDFRPRWFGQRSPSRRCSAREAPRFARPSQQDDKCPCTKTGRHRPCRDMLDRRVRYLRSVLARQPDPVA